MQSLLFDIGDPAKRCTKCGMVKPLADFSTSRYRGIRRRHSHCRACETIKNNKNYHRIRALPESDPRRQKQTQYRYAAHLKHRYGISLEEYEAMHARQKGLCAICKQPPRVEKGWGGGSGKRLVVDHCHATGQVRGLLCKRCNAVIGQFQDSPELLTNALAYLQQFNHPL